MAVISIPADSLLGSDSLPYGVFSSADAGPRIGGCVGRNTFEHELRQLHIVQKQQPLPPIQPATITERQTLIDAFVNE